MISLRFVVVFWTLHCIRQSQGTAPVPPFLNGFGRSVVGGDVGSKVKHCVIQPSDETRTNRTLGSNGFKLLIRPHALDGTVTDTVPDAAPSGYVPGEYYTIILEGYRTQYTAQTFRAFTIVAISDDAQNLDSPAGAFQFNEKDDVKWAPLCYHAVSETSLYPKTSASVIWQAPSLTTGCVLFKAMVLEYKDLWYWADGELTKKFCQSANDSRPTVKAPEQCCACDEAQYSMTFTGYWSKQTHPKDFPAIEHLTHFSDIVGGSHSDRYTMWAEGTYATDGMKQLAEWGDTTKYEEELKDKGREVRTVIKARGLWFPNVRGTAKAMFRTDKYHHLISLASMFGPSPDWIVGISSMDLCLKNCSWIDEMAFDLVPWDAGTDSGVTYMAPNNPTIPLDKIKPITTKQPADARAPFYAPNSDVIPALAKLVLKKEKIYPMSPCKDVSEYAQASLQESAAETSEDLEYKDRRECMTGPWTPWSICSASCGKGLRMRSRQYKNAAKARMAECRRQINEKQFCNAEISVCAGSEAFNDMCTTTGWADWTDCTVTCGKGLRSRSRNYNNPMAMKKCSVDLMEKETCIGQAGEDCNVQIDPACRTTYWSDWSPCSQSCGDGLRLRTRLFFFPENRPNCPATELVERSTCNVQSCEVFMIRHAQEICQELMEAGTCQGIFPRYYYDVHTKSCKRFIYTGCRGNRNNFESEDQCQTACVKALNGEIDESDNFDFAPGQTEGVNMVDGPPIHCMVTEWSAWSECTSTCNTGRKQRTRMVKVPASNGGHPCPRDMIQRARCRLRPCPADCRMTVWSDWSTCSATCGSGYRTRTRRGRSRLTGAATATHSCPLSQVDKRACNAIPCA